MTAFPTFVTRIAPGGLAPKPTDLGWTALPDVPAPGSPVQVDGTDYVVIGHRWAIKTVSAPEQLPVAVLTLFVATQADAQAMMRAASLVGAPAGALDVLKNSTAMTKVRERA